jgi:hypothetical protein
LLKNLNRYIIIIVLLGQSTLLGGGESSMQKSNAAEQKMERDKDKPFSPVPDYTDQGMVEVLERALPSVRKLLEIVRK